MARALVPPPGASEFRDCNEKYLDASRSLQSTQTLAKYLEILAKYLEILAKYLEILEKYLGILDKYRHS